MLEKYEKYKREVEKIESALKQESDDLERQELLLAEEYGNQIAKEIIDALIWSKYDIDLLKNEITSSWIIDIPNRFLKAYFQDTLWTNLSYLLGNKDLEAAKQLINKYFPRKALFQEERWEMLRPHFLYRIREINEHARLRNIYDHEIKEKDWKEVWDEICITALFLALENFQNLDVSLYIEAPFLRRSRNKQKLNISIWHSLRTNIRAEIERDLLSGATSDSTEFQKVDTLYEDFDYKGFEKKDKPMDNETDELLPEEINQRPVLCQMPPVSGWLLDEVIDYGKAIDTLNEKEKLILLADIANRSNLDNDPLEMAYITRFTDGELDNLITQTDEKLSTRFNVNIATIRQWRHRAKEKLRRY